MYFHKIKENNFCDTVCFPGKMESNPNGKKLQEKQHECFFFPLKVDPIVKEGKNEMTVNRAPDNSKIFV